MKVTDNQIRELLEEKGCLRFSTLMVRFHLSSNEAIRIVKEYEKKGIIDSKGKKNISEKINDNLERINDKDEKINAKEENVNDNNQNTNVFPEKHVVKKKSRRSQKCTEEKDYEQMSLFR